MKIKYHKKTDNWGSVTEYLGDTVHSLNEAIGKLENADYFLGQSTSYYSKKDNPINKLRTMIGRTEAKADAILSKTYRLAADATKHQAKVDKNYDIHNEQML